MRRSPLYRLLRRTSAIATLAILFITLASIFSSVFIWNSAYGFAGIQFGRVGWGEHTAKHGESHIYFDVRRPDFDWHFSQSGTATGMVTIITTGRAGWTRWMPLWAFLAPPAALWLFLIVIARRLKPGCCRDCGYDLKGVPRDDGKVTCPECGSRRGPLEPETADPVQPAAEPGAIGP